MTHIWHWTEPSDDGVLEVRIKDADRPVNVFSRAALDGLDELLEFVRSRSDVRGVLFFSGKPGCFIAGADVTELKNLAGVEQARAVSERGQRLFERVERLEQPTVAAIAGACLGGGLEFAMACDFRLAADDRKTLLGLPEVQLGLIPGWGGTVRLPRLIGLLDALPMILTGRRINGYQARSLGLVEDVLPAEGLVPAGHQLLQKASANSAADVRRELRRRPPLWKRLANRSRAVSRIVLRKARQRTIAATGGHYPAPLKALDVLEEALVAPNDTQRFRIEAKAVAELAESPVTRELMRLFFLQEAAKKPPADIAEAADCAEPQRMAVIGAGVMGAGIAQVAARNGLQVRLKDIRPEIIARGLRQIRDHVRRDLQRRRLKPTEATAILDRISPTTEDTGLKHCDLILEAIIEELPIKQAVFRDLAARSGERTVLATNTSSLPVADIGAELAENDRRRLVGLHFFNPPHRMPLVEVVRAKSSSREALAMAFAVARKLGKTPVVVGDCPGFLVNRLLAPYMNEAGYLLEELADPLRIDRVAVRFGMPMGPLELTDLVGWNVAAHVARHLHAAYGDRMKPASIWEVLEDLARSAPADAPPRLIRRTRRGRQLNPAVAKAIRQHLGAQPSASPSDDAIRDRLILPIINEACLCLEENVARTAEDIDLAMVFGTGFAPFRGGPMRYAETRGWSDIARTLQELAAQHPRLAPCDALLRRARAPAAETT